MVWTGGSEGRLAKSLIVLYDQVQAAFPANRDRSSDGTIASVQHHEANPSSDHEVREGEVTALDITHDPAHGLDCGKLVEGFKGDDRIKYIIWNRHIMSGTEQSHTAWEWRPYTGENPHTLHCHISVKMGAQGDQTQSWNIDGTSIPDNIPVPATIARGSTGADVKVLQTMLFADGIFGPATEAAVKKYQSSHGLVADGVVGPYTWRALLATAGPAPEPAEGWQTDITATVFGGDRELERSAYDSHVITNSELCVALPYRFSGTRPKVEVKGPNGTATATIQDVGPWNINDPYWDRGARPDAETHNHDHTPLTLDGPNQGKVPTNDAGIDLSPALARAIGVSGKGKVEWSFV